MQISVILCTYNRSRSLTKTLESIVVQELPDAVAWELLVVDSSNDDTRHVVEEFRAKYHGRIRYVFEGRRGKSYALNTGVKESRGEILAFVDDDVTFGPIWLANLTSSLLDGRCVGAGGRILLDWTAPRPRWLRTKGQNILEGVLAGFDRGALPTPLSEPPVGANMAFRKEMFSRYGNFRLDMGSTRGVLATSEDTEFGRRLLAAGERLRYEPDAVVYHPVPPKRLKKRYFLEFAFDYGRAIALEFGAPPAHTHWFGVPQFMIREFVGKTLRWLTAFRPYDRLFSKCKVWQAAGEIAEIRRQSISQAPERFMDRYPSLVREEWRSRAR